MRALLSVANKRGLAEFARGLAELGFELVASGGTALYLQEMAIAVTPVEQLTEVPELLGGRVKTLHPRVHAGILARRDLPDDIASLDEHAIAPFELVCVNLYPFADAAGRGAADEELIELIDIGGPALLRAAAKNHAHVAPVCSPALYDGVLEELRGAGQLSAATRRRLAAETFATTAAYEAAIATWFADGDSMPERLPLAYAKECDLVYGENPHQRAALYAAPGTPGLLAGIDQLQGRGLSATNVLDLALARRLLAELDGPACVIVKHANPCGAAVADTIEAAYERALACDPVSAFGMVCLLNRAVTAPLAQGIAARFVDAVAAPAYAAGALAELEARPGTRVFRGELGVPAWALDLRSVPGGVVAQEPDLRTIGRDDTTIACGRPGKAWPDLLFAWTVCKHTTSNAIVLARDGRTIGIGAGQVSRVDAVRIALDKARAHGHDVAGAVLASDGFFPFPDGPQLALDAGVRAFIQPGGSKRDDEATEAVERAGAAMVLTGVRHFRH